MTSRIKIFLSAFFVSLPMWLGMNFFQPSVESFLLAQISSIPPTSFVNVPRDLQKPKLELAVRAGLATRFKMGQERGVTLFEKNKETILPIASLTKLMTALVILENAQDYDFNQVVSVSKLAASQDDVPNYGNLKAGENFKIKKLLDLTLVYSSNDAALALAEVIGLDNFLAKMNSKTKELNLANTHFVNPTGLDPENLHFDATTQADFNYSTAQDLTILSSYILENYSLILEISSNGGPYPTLNGLAEIILPEDFMILGGKTGYTDEAKGCLLLILVSRNGDTFINLVLGADDVKERVVEMQKLVNWLAD